MQFITSRKEVIVKKDNGKEKCKIKEVETILESLFFISAFL